MFDGLICYILGVLVLHVRLIWYAMIKCAHKLTLCDVQGGMVEALSIYKKWKG